MSITARLKNVAAVEEARFEKALKKRIDEFAGDIFKLCAAYFRRAADEYAHTRSLMPPKRNNGGASTSTRTAKGSPSYRARSAVPTAQDNPQPW